MTTVNPRRFYVYAYLRTKASEHGPVGSPYYIGRGQTHRLHNVKQHSVGLPPREHRVKIATGLTHEEANEWEIALISVLGRIHLGTGCLRNMADGGNEGNTGWVPSAEYRAAKSADMREWHRANPGVHGAKISAAKMGGTVSGATRQKIAETLANAETAAAAGMTVEQWLALDPLARQRVVRQLEAGKQVQPDATLREIKACEQHGLTVAQWRQLTPLQRKHIARTKERAAAAGVPYFIWVALTKSEQIKLALVAA